jgi:hypothetical protein
MSSALQSNWRSSGRISAPGRAIAPAVTTERANTTANTTQL